jgi:hypothetical protein
MEQRINIFDAIAKMRDLTKRGEHFSMAFMSCDTSREQSKGLIEVPKARLRSAAAENAYRNSEHILDYLDVETNIPGRCYQILLMYFNNTRIEI